jgi:hypothetical protein
MAYTGIKRKLFITYSHLDEPSVAQFINYWAYREGVFIPKALGVQDADDFINSNDTEYVMSRIRQKYVGDSSVTLALIGTCTHSRRYVDWEIKASLRRAEDGLPNGLVGILLPPLTSAHLPERFASNLSKPGLPYYARYYPSPVTSEQLAGWIEDAFSARTNRAHCISNPHDVMKNNRECLVHGITH